MQQRESQDSIPITTGCKPESPVINELPATPSEPPLPNFEILDDRMAAIWQQKSGAERVRIACDLFAFARKLTLASVRSMHPDWSQEQIWRETARRLSHGAG